jgi:hypothetical protein
MGRKSHTWAPLSPAMGARNQVGIGLSSRPASLCSLATHFQTQFLESIPRPKAGLKFPTQALKSAVDCMLRYSYKLALISSSIHLQYCKWI